MKKRKFNMRDKEEKNSKNMIKKNWKLKNKFKKKPNQMLT